MQSYLVANPKGGVGKSTLATNLAGMFAVAGENVMLGDIDRQQSSRDWLRLRPTNKGCQRHQAGLHGKKLAHVLKVVQRVIVPLQPSIFDILATRHFLDALREEQEIRKHHAFVAIVGMRVDAHTRAAAELDRFLSDVGFPVLTCLRDTQNYVQAAAHGMTLFDLAPSRVQKDLEQWESIRRWTET